MLKEGNTVNEHERTRIFKRKKYVQDRINNIPPIPPTSFNGCISHIPNKQARCSNCKLLIAWRRHSTSIAAPSHHLRTTISIGFITWGIRYEDMFLENLWGGGLLMVRLFKIMRNIGNVKFYERKY